MAILSRSLERQLHILFMVILGASAWLGVLKIVDMQIIQYVSIVCLIVCVFFTLKAVNRGIGTADYR